MNDNLMIRHATAADMPGIRALLKKYHRDTISDEDRPGGFVTTAITDEQLTDLIEKENGVMIIVRPQAAPHFSQRAAAAMKQDHRNGPHVDLSQNNHRSQLF